MANFGPLPHSWRLSRYEHRLRSSSSRWESWTSYSDVGKKFNGLELVLDEYVRVENLYIAAITRFAVELGVHTVVVGYVANGGRESGVTDGQEFSGSDLAPLIRGNLREQVNCVIADTAGALQVAFGYDLYVNLAATRPCEDAVNEAYRSGLYLEAGVPIPLWENL